MIKLLASTYLATTLAQNSFDTTFDDSFGGGSMGDSFSMGGTDMDGSFGGSMDDSFGGSMDATFGGSMDNSFAGSMDDSFEGSMGTIDDSFGGSMGTIDDSFGGSMGTIDDSFGGSMGTMDDSFMGSVDDGFSSMGSFCGDGICDAGELDMFCLSDCEVELKNSLCSCVGEFSLCDETCSAFNDDSFLATTECQMFYAMAFCGSLLDQDTLYRDFCGIQTCPDSSQLDDAFCGDGICQDGEVESFCIVDCTDELADNLCSCVGELDLCDETCAALTTSQSGASSECQLMYSLAFCGQLIDDQTSYRDFCGATTCPSTLVDLDTALEPTNMPTPAPTFSCSFEEKNDQCWSISQITKQDCSEISQWWKQIGRFLDVHGIRNYGIDSYGVDIGGDFNKLADVKKSFLDYCASL